MARLLRLVLAALLLAACGSGGDALPVGVQLGAVAGLELLPACLIA